jgi:hypothetical protein
MEQQEKKPFYKKKWFIGLAIFFGIGLIGTIFDDTPRPTPTSTPTQEVKTETQKETTTTKPIISKDEAQKEFDRLIGLSKQSGLVTSYEMTAETPLKIFVSKVWYTQEVSFKKDMIAKFSTLEQAIYGRHRLEVRDAYSNEKVAEVTAFSGSLEVYK